MIAQAREQEVLALDGRPLLPAPPRNVDDTGLSVLFLVELAAKTLFLRGTLRLTELSQHLKLPATVVDAVLKFMRTERMCEVVRRGETDGDVYYNLTDTGRLRAGEFLQKCQYAGPAPVTLHAYERQVRLQSVKDMRITAADIDRAFEGVIVALKLREELGAAMNCGRALFVYGPAGSGKTFIAGRLARLLSGNITVPYAICVDDQVVQVFDPLVHHAVEEEPGSMGGIERRSRLDARWRLCSRPVALSGGELTMDMLNLYFDLASHLHYAPPHVKANNGLYIVDDLGRQMISPQQLMSRWIVPMDQHVDYQALHNGYKFAVPFDVILVFSTNMSPGDLADPAFLRRLGYKIHVGALDESEYRALFRKECIEHGLDYSDDAFEYLVREHHEREGTALLACYPRDLLGQIRARARYRGEEPRLTSAALAQAWRNYFASD